MWDKGEDGECVGGKEMQWVWKSNWTFKEWEDRKERIRVWYECGRRLKARECTKIRIDKIK